MLTFNPMWRAALVWLLSTSGIPGPETIEGALAIEQRGDDLGALDALEGIIRYRPAFALARLEAARLYLKTDRGLTRAQGHLEAALTLVPEDARAHYLWALTMEGRGRPDEVIHALDLAVALNPDLGEARERLGAAHASRGEWSAAEAQFRALTGLQPASVQARLLLADALARQSKWSEAQEELRTAFKAQPDSPLLASRLAEACERSGRSKEAMQLRAAIAAPRKLRPLPKSRQ